LPSGHKSILLARFVVDKKKEMILMPTQAGFSSYSSDEAAASTFVRRSTNIVIASYLLL
jgi:hypothetical protein